jgi:hypothetical protein
MTLPTTDGDPAQVQLFTTVVPIAGAPSVDQVLFTVGQPGRVRGSLVSKYTDWAGFAAEIGEWLVRSLGASQGLVLAELMSKNAGLPMVFLKQFADEQGGGGACYRALVEGTIDIIDPKIAAGPLDGDYPVTLQRYASHQIASTLGLQVSSSGPNSDVLRPLLQGWMTMRAAIQPGRIIATLPTTTSSVASPNRTRIRK